MYVYQRYLIDPRPHIILTQTTEPESHKGIWTQGAYISQCTVLAAAGSCLGEESKDPPPGSLPPLFNTSVLQLFDEP